MLRKRIITGTLMALSLSLLVFTGCRQPGHHRGAEFMIDYMSEALDLTDSQQAQLDEIKDELFAKAKRAHPEKRGQRAEVMALLKSEEIERRSIESPC